MPKQCPECRSFAPDEVGYCPACACKLGSAADAAAEQRWQQTAAGIALGCVAGTMLYFWWVFLRP